MKILLTGATGFLGSALAQHWVQAGHALTLMVRPSSSLWRLQSVLPAVQLVRCARDPDILECVRSAAPDVIVHTACAYGRQGETAQQLLDTNVRLSVLLMDAVLAQKSERVSFINTGTVLEPSVSYYALSKQQFTQWGDALARRHAPRLQFINIRLQHMYGPHDDASKFTSHVLRACQQHQAQLALTAGEQQRDFIYIDDVVSAYDVLLQHLNQLPETDQIDVGSGKAVTLRHFVEQVHTLTASRTQLQFGALPYRAHEAPLYQADTQRLTALGWQAAYGLTQGLQKTIELEFAP